MAIFGVELEDSSLVRDYMAKTNERLSVQNMVTNPFNGKVKEVSKTGGLSVYIVLIEPIWPPFPLIGALFILIPMALKGLVWTWWYLPGMLLLPLSLLWTRQFMYFVCHKGIKKAGYKGKIRQISHSKLLKILIE